MKTNSSLDASDASDVSDVSDVSSRTWPWLAMGLGLIASPAIAQDTASSLPGTHAVTVMTEMVRWPGLIASVFLVIGAWLVLRIASRLVENLGAAFVDSRLTLQKIAAFFRFGVYLATIVGITLLSFDISPEVLAIVGGTAAVAIGFAMKDLLAAVAAGMMIMFDRPFQVGDRVTFGDQYGDIVSVGLRSVKLRTLDDSMVTIPNNLFLSDVSICGNYGVLNMQVMIDFLIGIDQDVHRARELVREACITSNFVYLANPIEVLVSQVVHGEFIALRLRLKVYVIDTALEKALETDITLRVMDAFRDEGIQPPAVLHRQVDDGRPLTLAVG